MTAEREWFEKDYYAVLGVGASATEKELTRAYRKLAKTHHPDANAGDLGAEEKFKEISAAYDVIGDAAKRAEYDEVRAMVASGAYGPGGQRRGGGGGFGSTGPGGFSFGEGDTGGLDDLLGQMFGRSAARRGGQSAGRAGPRRGGDLETELRLSFVDAAQGVTVPVRFTAEATCSTCKGVGARPGTHAETCGGCGGTGSTTVNQGPFSFAQVCPKCGGNGKVITDPCPTCRGQGVEVRPREVKIRVPVGVADGQRIRAAGRGKPGGIGGAPGDLFVIVRVDKHPIFGRKARDLTLRLPVTFPEAVLGAQVKVPTLDEPVTLRIPPGTPSGKTLRVRGRGLADGKGGHGDLLITIEVAIPQKLSAEEQKAVELLAGALTGDPRSGFTSDQPEA